MNSIRNRTIRGQGQRIVGVNDVRSLLVENCVFSNCVFGYNGRSLPGKIDTIQDCVLANCKASKCVVGPAIVRATHIENLANDMLMCWGTLFDQVTLVGKIGPIILHGIPKSTSNQSTRQSHRVQAENFYINVEFSLDISKAQFNDFSIRTGAIPLSLVRRDTNSQFIISALNCPLSTDRIASLPVSRYTKMVLAFMIDDGVSESLLVAPKLDLELYEQVLRDVDVLEREDLLAK